MTYNVHCQKFYDMHVNQVVNIPSFIVRLESQKHIDFALKSPFGGGGPGRVKRKNATPRRERLVEMTVMNQIKYFILELSLR